MISSWEGLLIFPMKQLLEGMMARNVAIGIQQFDELIEKNCFYVDKTDFIREWWESNDSVTLITRPRRFGKTLNMSMTEQFFSVELYMTQYTEFSI